MKDLIPVICSQSGQIRTVTTRKVLKTRVAYKNVTVERHSQYQVRFGIQYENKNSTQVKREFGIEPEPLKKRGLSYDVYPFIAKNNAGQKYAACSPVKSGFRKDEYFLNGVLTTKNAVEQFCLANELSTHEGAEWLFIKLDNILEIK